MQILKTIAAAAILAVASATATFAHGYTLGDIEIKHPNARATVPGAKVGGGFMTLINHGSEDDRLISITTPVSDDPQIHEMTMENDVMKMRRLKDGVDLPPGATVELKPGGFHIMFMGIKQPFTEGEKISATLHFERAGDVDVEFVVGPANGQPVKHDSKDMKNMGGMKMKNGAASN